LEVLIAPSQDIDKKEMKTNVNVRINVPQGDPNSRLPCDICCVVDISGSMANSAAYEDADDNRVDHGFS